jgi:hypothetical protein
MAEAHGSSVEVVESDPTGINRNLVLVRQQYGRIAVIAHVNDKSATVFVSEAELRAPIDRLIPKLDSEQLVAIDFGSTHDE